MVETLWEFKKRHGSNGATFIQRNDIISNRPTFQFSALLIPPFLSVKLRSYFLD